MQHQYKYVLLSVLVSSACSSGAGSSSNPEDSSPDTTKSSDTATVLDSTAPDVGADSTTVSPTDSTTTTTTTDTAVQDTFKSEAAVDSAVTDSGVDTAVQDTFKPETAVDSTATDTGADTSVPDTATTDAGSVTGPCNIYAAANNPCVAAFSTVRALFGNYTGNLYQVRRTSDNTTKDIGVLSTGGVANAATQDAFCTGTGSCTISIIYDQSGKGNHLTKAPGGSAAYGPNPDLEAVADALPITINGHKAYGVHVTPDSSWTGTTQVGYRNTATKGTATGDNPETEYEVTDGKYVNGSCCFDFGNSEMQAVAGGPGNMEAIYFGTVNWWDTGAGNGPWVMADLEVGVYSEGGAAAVTTGSKQNTQNISLPDTFVTAMVKGNSQNATTGGPFTLKGGNAQSGTLTTMWDGAFPTGYSPRHLQGGIVLGVGGDNSGTSQGDFYEGVMTTGYATTATDNAIQANIVAAGYGH